MLRVNCAFHTDWLKKDGHTMSNQAQQSEHSAFYCSFGSAIRIIGYFETAFLRYNGDRSFRILDEERDLKLNSGGQYRVANILKL